MSVSYDDVRHIAALARVGVDDRRLPALAAELSGILDHMAVLARVDTSSVADVSRDGDVHTRPDSGPPIPLLRPLAAFAPMVRDGFLIVPRLATHGGGVQDSGVQDSGVQDSGVQGSGVQGSGVHGAPAGDDRPDEEDAA